MRAQVGLAVVVAAAAAACGGSSSGGGATGQPQSQGTQSQGSQSQGGSSGQSSAVQHPKSLVGEVGKNDSFAISLKDDQGQDITNLAAGTYSLKVEDLSAIHNFHLSGSGIDASTDVGAKTTKTFSVTFKPGTYSFVCDPHASSMHGDFTVT
jgi:plastocyanin